MLINSTVSFGANSPPDLTAATSCHTDTARKWGHRAQTARAVNTIAATASPTSPPAGSGMTGAGSSAQASAVNPTRTGPARASNRRNQPRTVDAARPTIPAMRR